MQNKEQNRFLYLPAVVGGTPLPFEMQPIMHVRNRRLFGHEILYRGAPPATWNDIDRAVLNFLLAPGTRFPEAIFVNLSNTALIDMPGADLIAASRQHNIFFELNEKFVDSDSFARVAEKVNGLCAKGVPFAIDDFGSGEDGFRRIYALDRIAAVKIDGALLASAKLRGHAAQSLKSLIAHWNAAGVITVAECIESPALLQFATDMGVAMVQGFFIDRHVLRKP